MSNIDDPSVTDGYDYPTEPINTPATNTPGVTTPAAVPPASGTHWLTVLAAAGAAAVVAVLILSIGIVGLVVTNGQRPVAAAPATVVQLGQAGPVPTTQPTGPAQTSSEPGPGTDAPTPVGPAPAAVETTPATGPGTAATSSPGTRAQPAITDANFKVTVDRPTLADLYSIVRFLVETPASDQAKAANVEGGMAAVVVPRTVYSLGLFRAPLGWNKITGPLVQNGNSVTATLNSGSAGRPTIRMTIEFKKLDGNWKLAASSLCQGVKAVGLNIYCNQ